MRFSLVSMPRPLPSSPNSTWNCVVWEHDYLQYSWIVFPHCSTVTAVSRVSVDKFLVSLVSNDHISYHDDFMMSLINTTWRVEWAKSYRITICQHNYQLSSVALFVLFLILATLYETESKSSERKHRQIWRCNMFGPVQITHLQNFSTVIVLLNTDMVLQLLSVVVNNSKNWHCLQSGKMKAE